MTSRLLARTGLVAALLLSLLTLQSCGRGGSAAAEPSGPGVTLSVDGRPFNLYTPPGLEGRSGPLVLALHGGLGSATRFQASLPLFDEAARNGFRVAYLDGTLEGRERGDRRTWNAGNCCRSARDQGVNDVGYISDVIATLIGQGLTSPGQVWLVGHSNGAMMSYRLACTRPDLVGGVVAIAGVLAIPSCDNSAGVRVLHIHGLQDPVVPIDGGGQGVRLTDQPFRSVQQTTDAVRAGGASVELLLVPGGEHEVDSIDRALRAELGQTLAGLVGQTVRGQ
jgi:polyhydroxybutyrate depolymerase